MLTFEVGNKSSIGVEDLCCYLPVNDPLLLRMLLPCSIAKSIVITMVLTNTVSPLTIEG